MEKFLCSKFKQLLCYALGVNILCVIAKSFFIISSNNYQLNKEEKYLWQKSHKYHISHKLYSLYEEIK